LSFPIEKKHSTSKLVGNTFQAYVFWSADNQNCVEH